MSVTTGDDLLRCLRDYALTFPCMCDNDRDEYQCLTCRAEEMIAILEPPKVERRYQVVRLTLYGRLGPISQTLIPNTQGDIYRYDIDPAAEVKVVTVEWVS